MRKRKYSKRIRKKRSKLEK